jgi:hypothetical protein
VKIVERLTKGESKNKNKNKSHEASYIVVEVRGTSTFVTHDVTKVEVRWAETHLKFKSHAPKERGRLTPRTSARLSVARPSGPGRAMVGPCGQVGVAHGLFGPEFLCGCSKFQGLKVELGF